MQHNSFLHWKEMLLVGSCGTDYWSNGCRIDKLYFTILSFFKQINADLASIRKFFPKRKFFKIILTYSKIFNGSVHLNV